MRKTRTTNRQNAENGPLRRSHFARSLDVHKEYASGSRSLRPSNELVLSNLPKLQPFARCGLAGRSFSTVFQDCCAVSETIQNCTKRDTNDASPVESLWSRTTSDEVRVS